MNPLTDNEHAVTPDATLPAASRGAEPFLAPPAFELKKILVPVDFSDGSSQALKYATTFAKQFDAELKLLHVVEIYPAVPAMGPVDVESLKDSRAALECCENPSPTRSAAPRRYASAWRTR